MIQNPTSMINKVSKRLFFSAARLNSLTNQKIFKSKRIRYNQEHYAPDPKEFINSILESSVKPYLNISKLHLLHRYINHVNFVRSAYSFVCDENVAKDIVEKITSKTDFSKCLILEGNPGLGLITLNLLNYDISQLYVCDSCLLQELSLQQIIKNHSNKIIFKKFNINKNSDDILLSVMDEAEKKNLIPTFILVASSFYFIRVLIMLFLKNGLWHNKCDFYLVLTSHVLSCIKNFTPFYFKYVSYCAFNLLFVTEILATYPSSGFLPLSMSKEDDGDFHLVKLSINPNILNVIDEEDLLDYIIFITILGTSCQNGIIPTLEKWLPDCGPYLISKGISITNIIMDISFEESIVLFKLFKECEGYNYFKMSINNAFENSVVG